MLPERKNAQVDTASGAVEVVPAPRTPDEVRRFLPRLSRALAGGAPLTTATSPPGSHTSVPWDAALVVPTSGTSGVARWAVLSRGALATSADLTHHVLGGRGRWLLALPTTHIAGLQVLVRSLRSRYEPAVLDLTEPFTVERFVSAVDLLDAEATEHPHYTALVPTQLQRLLDDGAGVEALWKLDAVLIGGAAADPSLLSRASDSGVTLVRTYGMTETCGGCVYDGTPLPGVEVDIDAEERVRLRGPVLFDGYLGSDVSELSGLDDGWFTTSDLGRLDGGVLTVQGRVDNVINSGGVKVPAESVERALLALDLVDDAVVVGVEDAEWGQRVVAVMVSAADPTTSTVREALRGSIPDAWLPRGVLCVDQLPQLPTGKPDRVAVRAMTIG